MHFIDQEVFWDAPYRAYLSSIGERLPMGVKAFAMHDWYHSPQDHRCPHDSWLQEFSILEPAEGDRLEVRNIEIRLCLLGAYHDGYIRFRYSNVCGYALSTPIEHSVRSNGSVEHEIKFSKGSRFRVVCSDIDFDFTALS
jgi:hypothetical protein